MSKRNIAAAVLLIVWLGFIFSMSAQTAEISGGNSTGIAEKIAPMLIPGYEQMSESIRQETIHLVDLVIRKSAHAAEYAILAILCIASLPKHLKNRVLFSWIFSVIYASSDEIHQIFVPGRAGMIQDVVIDSLGAFLGVGIWYVFRTLFIFMKQRKTQR